jgi:hypothetical protein
LTDGPSWQNSHLGSFADTVGGVLKTFVDDAGQTLKSSGS